MQKENASLELPARLLQYATDIAGWQLEKTELDMQRHPDRYAEYADARERRAEEETALIQKLGDEMALEAYSAACNAYAAALAVEMYLRGVMDGGRIYHAFTMRELPQRGEPHA